MYSTENSTKSVQFLIDKPFLKTIELGFGTLQLRDIDILVGLPKLESLELSDCQVDESLLLRLSKQQRLKFLGVPAETTKAMRELLKKQLKWTPIIGPPAGKV